MSETETKKYYWLKLKEDFFTDKEIKKLRKIAGGDTYTIIYLKLMLLGLRDEGKLYFEGIEDTFVEELALELDEEADNVKFTLLYLVKMGLVEEITESELLLTRLPELVGKETSKAELMRKKRAREKAARLSGGNNVTEALPPVTKCYTEIEKEKEREIEEELKQEPKQEKKKSANALPSVSTVSFETEFETLWKLYPKKQGKSNALRDYIKARKDKKNPASYEQVLQGLQNYLAYLKAKQVEERFIKQGSTWFHQRCWEDEYNLQATGSDGYEPVKTNNQFLRMLQEGRFDDE